MSTKRALCALALAALVLIQALVRPAPVRAFFGDITLKDELEMGRKFNDMVRAKMPMVEDPEVINYVKGVVDCIVSRGLPPQPFKITVAVINNGSMNAFAVPGGYVYVFTGLIKGVEKEGQLAAVLCHELAHVTQRHVVKRMEDMRLINLVSMVGLVSGLLLGAGGGGDTKDLGKGLIVGAQSAGQAAFLSYTRQNENEADHVGMNYLLAAGYNPQDMPDTFKTMLKKKWYAGQSSVPSYLYTHPQTEERVAYMEDRIKRMPPDDLMRKTDNTEFYRIQTLIRAKSGDPAQALAFYKDKNEKTGLNCLDHMGRGMALSRLNQAGQAQRAFEQAMACAPEDPLVLREAGYFYFTQGEFAKAGPLLQKAAFLAPDDALALFYTARLEGERKDYGQAISTMRKVCRAVPEDSEVRYHLGRLLGESGDLFGAHLQLAYASIYDRNPKKARFHLEKARALAKTQDQKQALGDLDKLLKDRFDKD
ncbi:MAG: M48 family metalloprotease [Desulfovibrionaceae bacterium]|nr:M48 family metalloprotease [Desulfovibrionaceae bacterium]